MSKTPVELADDFIQNETQFHLGFLITEQSHPRTRGLSQALARDSKEGVRMLLSVDDDLPPVIEKTLKSENFQKLEQSIETTLANGGRVHFSGCGATGRLSILLDSSNRRFWREAAEKFPELKEIAARFFEQTNAVMTGGDFALIRSVESFEDFQPFGYQQMLDAKVSPNDCLVAISEGGETSSVIGTIHAALDTGAKTNFLFNNPSELMCEHTERSREVIQDERVNVVNLTTGPMGIAGSTRMQATTIEMIIAGIAYETAMTNVLKTLLSAEQLEKLGVGKYTPEEIAAKFSVLLQQLRTDENVKMLGAYIDFESGIYANKGLTTYFADQYLIDIFTDTTERAPTFKTPPFRSTLEPELPPAWAFVKDAIRPSRQAWMHLLGHEPRCLEWTPEDYRRLKATEAICENPPIINRERTYTFMIGNEPDPSRYEVKPNLAIALLVGDEYAYLQDPDNSWMAAFNAETENYDYRKIVIIADKKFDHPDAFSIVVDIPKTPLDLFGHLASKLVLNNISSAALGKLGRLNSNWMAHVDASNKKLIDRSVRLVSELAGVDYRTACIEIFKTMEEMKSWPETRRKVISPAAYAIEQIQACKAAEGGAQG